MAAATDPVIYVCKEGAVFEVDGVEYAVVPGTTVEAGHPMLKSRMDLFRPLVADYLAPVKEASPVGSSARADLRGARTR